MIKRENLPFLVFGFVCLLAVLLAGGYFVSRRIQEATAPVYTFTQSPSKMADYMSSTLSSGGIVYENDVPEFSMNMGSTVLTRIIGRTQDELLLYAFSGHNPPDYVVLTGFMMSATIFRNSQKPAFDWRSASFQEMRLTIDTAKTRRKTTRDPQVIAEVIAALKSGFGGPRTLPVDGGDTVFLTSSQVPPGLFYCVKMYVDSTGQVYLAESALSNQWFTVGQLFSAWVKT